MAALALSGRRVVERIPARVVIDWVLADVGVDCQQSVSAERALVAGRDTPGEHSLMLILLQLIVVVGYLKPAPRGKQVQVKCILAVRKIVEVIEDGLVVALV